MKPPITPEEKNLFSACSSTRHFLFSRTGPCTPGARTVDPPFTGSAALLEIYPDMPAGKAFVDHALASLAQTGTFGALVIRMDPVNPEQTAPEDRHITAVGQIIAAASQSCKAIWGQFGQETWGCFLPEADDAACRKFDAQIKTELAEQRLPTVTTGIASYPCLDFSRPQVLENLGKALHHATFFGPGAVAVFDAVSLNISGDQYYQAGQIERAVAEFETALRLDPANVNLHNSLGVCYGGLDKQDAALKEFEISISLDPDDFMAVYNAGLIHLLMDHKDAAMDHFRRAGDMKKDVFEIIFQTGRLLLETGKPREALPLLEKSAGLKPDSSLVFRYQGDCLAALDMPEKAAAAYKKAIQRNPYDAHCISALGWLFAEKGESLEIATLFCRQGVELAPDNGLFHSRLGRLYHKADRLDEALAELETADRLGHDVKALIKALQDELRDKVSACDQSAAAG